MAGSKCRIALNCEYVTVKVTECVLVVMSGLFCKRHIAVKAKLLCLHSEIDNDYFEGKSFIDPFLKMVWTSLSHFRSFRYSEAPVS